jgi:hypothetical protein
VSGRDSPPSEPRPLTLSEDPVKLFIERAAAVVEFAHLRVCRRCRL